MKSFATAIIAMLAVSSNGVQLQSEVESEFIFRAAAAAANAVANTAAAVVDTGARVVDGLDGRQDGQLSIGGPLGGSLTVKLGADRVGLGAAGSFNLARLIATDALRTASGALTLSGGVRISGDARLRLIAEGAFVIDGQLYNKSGARIDVNGTLLGGALQLAGDIAGGIAGAVNLAGAIAGDALRLASGALRIGGRVLDDAARLRLIADGAFMVNGRLYNSAGLEIDVSGNVIGAALDLAGGIGLSILGAGAAALDVAGDLAGAAVGVAAAGVGAVAGLGAGLLNLGGGLLGGAANLAGAVIGGGLRLGAELVGGLLDGVRVGAEGTFDLAALLAADALRTASGAITIGGIAVSNAQRLELIRRGFFVLNGKVFDKLGFEINLQTGARLGGRLDLNIEGGFEGAANLALAIGGDALRLAGDAALTIGGRVLDRAARLRLIGDGAFFVGGKLYNRAGLQIDIDGRVIGGALDLAGGIGLGILGAGAAALDVAGDLAGLGASAALGLGAGALGLGAAGANAAIGLGFNLLGLGAGILGEGLKAAVGVAGAGVALTAGLVDGALDLGLGVIGAGLNLAGGVLGGLAAGAAGSFDLAAAIAGDALRVGSAGLRIGGQLIDEATRRRLVASGSFTIGGKLFNSAGLEIDISGRVIGPQLRLGADITGGLSGAIGLAGAIAGDALRLGGAGLTIAGQAIDAATRARLIANGAFVFEGQLYNRRGLRIDLSGKLIGGAIDLAADVGAGLLAAGGGALAAAGGLALGVAGNAAGTLAAAAGTAAETALELGGAALRIAAGVFDGTRNAIAVALDAGIDLAAFIATDALRSARGGIQFGAGGPIMSNARRLELIAQGAFVANGKLFNANGFQINIDGSAAGGTLNLQLDLAAAIEANASLRIGGSAGVRVGGGAGGEISFALA